MRIVEPAVANYGTFSIDVARLILGTCSEAEVVAKVPRTQVGPNANPVVQGRM